MDLIDDFRLVRCVVELEKILVVLPSPGSHSNSLLMRSEGMISQTISRPLQTTALKPSSH